MKLTNVNYKTENDSLYAEDIKNANNQNKVRTNIAKNFLDELLQNMFFATSTPEIDLEFVQDLLDVYDIGTLKREIKKAKLWLVSNPGREKKNYRKFITNWMSNSERKVYLDR
jgi:hypothetical protein